MSRYVVTIHPWREQVAVLLPRPLTIAEQDQLTAEINRGLNTPHVATGASMTRLVQAALERLRVALEAEGGSHAP